MKMRVVKKRESQFNRYIDSKVMNYLGHRGRLITYRRRYKNIEKAISAFSFFALDEEKRKQNH